MELPLNQSNQKALNYLSEGLDRGAWREGERLPTARELARAIGVGMRSVCAAVLILRNQRRISAVRGKGIIAGVFAPRLQPTERRRKRQDMVRRIEADIFNRALVPRERIWTLRELGVRYGASYRVVKKAVTRLCAMGLLATARRGYCVADSRTAQSYASVLLLCRSDISGKIDIMNVRFREFLSALEIERTRISMNLKRQVIFEEASPRNAAIAAQLVKDDAYVGYVIWATGLNVHLINALLLELRTVRKPVAVIDEDGTFLLHADLIADKFVRIFTLAARTAGEQVGRYLLVNGHRRIAYLSTEHGNSWSQLRLRGLVDAYGQAGFADAVIPMIRNSMTECGPVEPRIMRIIDHQVAPKSLREQRKLVFLRLLENDPIYSLSLEGTELTRRGLEPMIESICKNSRASALVFCFDVAAIIGMDLLRGRGKRIPRDFSLMGFDDTQGALQHDLSSYNFAIPSIAHLALGFLFNPDYEKFRSSQRIECEGMIIERGSTRAIEPR